MAKEKKKRSVILKIITVLLALILLCCVTFVILVNWMDLRSREEGTAPGMFKTGFIPITADVNNEPFYRGDLLLISQDGPYETGDCVVLENVIDASTEELTDGRFLIGRILSVEGGDFQVVTRSESPQMVTVNPEQVYGTVTYVMKGVGLLFDFVRVPLGFFIVILTPFLILILWIFVLSFLAHRRRIKEAAQLIDEEEPVLPTETINSSIPMTEESVDLIGNADRVDPFRKEQQEKQTEEKTEEKKKASVFVPSQPDKKPENRESNQPKETKPEQPEKLPQQKETVQPNETQRTAGQVVSAVQPASSQTVKTKTETATETGLPKRASQLYYEKEVDAILNELMAEMKQTEEKTEQIYAQPAPQPKTVQEEGKRPLSSPKTERPSFLNMTTDEIIEQFTMELEEARLRPLDEDQNQSK